MLGWPNHPIGGGQSLCLVFSSFFSLFFLDLKKKKKTNICDGGILGKKVKVVELPQFESLGELSVTFETLEVNVKMGG
jgi:hypothetical protein